MEILEGKVLLWLDSARFVKSKSGVYVLYDKKLNPIYIGESDNLQKVFANYADTNFDNDECKQKTHTYQRMFVENHKELQMELLDDFKAKYGSMPNCNA